MKCENTIILGTDPFTAGILNLIQQLVDFLIGHFNMKTFQICFGCLFLSSLWLLCGCSTELPPAAVQAQVDSEPTATAVGQRNNGQPGTWITFTNANVVMWVPASVVSVWDGSTCSVEAEGITPTRALPQEYKILVEIQIDSEQEFKKNTELYQGWYFQEHPTLSTRDGQESRQFRKDIRDPELSRILLVNGMVDKSDTFDKDVETAKKMIESIKLIKK